MSQSDSNYDHRLTTRPYEERMFTQRHIEAVEDRIRLFQTGKKSALYRRPLLLVAASFCLIVIVTSLFLYIEIDLQPGDSPSSAVAYQDQTIERGQYTLSIPSEWTSKSGSESDLILMNGGQSSSP
jgi:hypothetical protein